MKGHAMNSDHIENEIERREREDRAAYSESGIRRKGAADIAYENLLDDQADARAVEQEQSCDALRTIGRSLLTPEDFTMPSGERTSRSALIRWRPNQYGFGVRIEHRQHGSMDFSVASLSEV